MLSSHQATRKKEVHHGGQAYGGIWHLSRHRESGGSSLPSKTAGFQSDSLSFLLPDHENKEKFAHEKHSKAPEGTTAGVITGGAIGGLIGLMAGAGAPCTFPGVGLLLAAGPIVAALAGFGAGGAGGGI